MTCVRRIQHMRIAGALFPPERQLKIQIYNLFLVFMHFTHLAYIIILCTALVSHKHVPGAQGTSQWF